MANLSLEEILDRVRSICIRQGVEQLYLFGSFAKGDATRMSDIDVAVRGCRDYGELKEQIDRIPILKKIDVVDMDTCRNSLLLEDIEKYGRKIY